jgi:hypothetical protein
MFGDDGIFIGSANGMTEGAGVEGLFRNLVITHNKGGTTADAMVMSNAGPGVFRKYRFEDGCVFSYNQRAGLQLNGDVIIDAPNDPVIITGHSTNGYWLVNAGNTERTVNGLIVHDNGFSGFLISGIGTTVNFTVRNTIVSNNGVSNFNFASSAGPAPNVLLEDVTIANPKSGTNAFLLGANVACNVTVRNSIIAGNGSLTNNIVNHNGSGTLTLEGTALVTEGQFALASGTVGGTGTVVGSPTVTSDPEFVETVNFSSPSFFDVAAAEYATANATGGNLSGGGDYVGGSSVDSWSIY